MERVLFLADASTQSMLERSDLRLRLLPWLSDRSINITWLAAQPNAYLTQRVIDIARSSRVGRGYRWRGMTCVAVPYRPGGVPRRQIYQDAGR